MSAMPAGPFAIETQGLTKLYGDRPVVRSLDLKIPAGCVYGFLGRNGAGKSTTLKMLMGMVWPDSGRARLLGEDVADLTPATRARIAYIAEGHPLYGWMTVDAIERFTRPFYPRWNKRLFEQIIEHFQLARRKTIRKLSNGQRAQLSLALAIAPDPELLILDDRTLDGSPAIWKERAQIQSRVLTANQDRRAVRLLDANQEGWAGWLFAFPDNSSPPTYWYFVVAADTLNGRGYFVGYDSQTRLAVGYLGRDGFTNTMPVRDAQFPIDGARFRYGGSLFGCLTSGQTQGFSPGGLVTSRSDCTYPPWIFYLHSGAQMLKIDLAGRTVGKAIEADDVLSIGQVVHREPEDAYSTKNQQTLALRRPDRVTYFNPVDESALDWSIPSELRDKDFTFYPVTEQMAIVDIAHPIDSRQRHEHELVWLNRTGGVTRREQVSLKGYPAATTGFEAAAPFLVLPEPLLWACVLPTIDADQPRGIPAFADAWQGVLFVSLTTVIAVFLADRKQRRAGLPRSYAWLAFVLLLGMPGYLGFLVHRRWPRQAMVPPPEMTGSEIFA